MLMKAKADIKKSCQLETFITRKSVRTASSSKYMNVTSQDVRIATLAMYTLYTTDAHTTNKQFACRQRYTVLTDRLLAARNVAFENALYCDIALHDEYIRKMNERVEREEESRLSRLDTSIAQRTASTRAQRRITHQRYRRAKAR
jgi:hypothetical protein